jgi:glyoxylase-like metal-dependent hydrolase (beta-lactamase superfamily II)
MTDMPLHVLLIPVTPFQQNCSLLWCAQTMRGAVVDPGGEVERVQAAAEERGVTIEKILLTHGHLDHAGGAARLARALDVPIEGPHEGDLFLLERLDEQGARWGLPAAEPCRPGRWLGDGDQVRVGALSLDVRHCPGHTPGHVVFVHQAARLAFVGDVLFAGSIGRTDLPGGSYAELIASIIEKLWPLGDDMRFVPGHGQPSTFGWERKTNAFVSDLALGRA